MANNGDATTLHPEPITASHLIEAILLRLPAADVYRFRAVCRRWRGIIDGEGFIAAHRQRRAPKPLFLYRRDFSLRPLGRDEDPRLVRVDLQAVDVAARESHQVLRFRDVPNPHSGPAVAIADSMFKVQGSCDGILLVSYLDHVYACNPCTGHWRRLPPMNLRETIIGFYARERDPPGEGRAYRVLYQTGAPYIDLSYRIRTLELGAEEPLDIGLPTSPGTPHPQALRNLVLFPGRLPPAHRAPPTMFQGNLHWLLGVGRTHRITVFGTAAQEFRWMRTPALPAADEAGVFQLLEIHGRLAMASIDAAVATIHVWVLRDYANQTWEPGHQIELPPAAITRDIGYDPLDHPHPPAFIVSQERDVLLRCPYAMLHCDAVGNVLRQYWRPHHRIIATPHMFQESLAFPSRRINDHDGKNGQKPFLLPHEP